MLWGNDESLIVLTRSLRSRVGRGPSDRAPVPLGSSRRGPEGFDREEVVG